jgi:hypothetical protein
MVDGIVDDGEKGSPATVPIRRLLDIEIPFNPGKGRLIILSDMQKGCYTLN